MLQAGRPARWVPPPGTRGIRATARPVPQDLGGRDIRKHIYIYIYIYISYIIYIYIYIYTHTIYCVYIYIYICMTVATFVQ